MDQLIPFNRPSLEGAELEHVQAAVLAGHASAKGPFSQRVADLLRDEIGAQDVLLTTSCTAALEMTALLLDLQPGDTVIVPSFTFVTSASAFVRSGARLLFADIEPTMLGIDPAHVAELLDDSVRAVVAVHYAGVACDLDGLADVLRQRPDVAVIEDNAHGLFGTLHDKPLGSFGRFSTLSFHETKNFSCGEGGALVMNRADDVERAHIIYDKGTNRRSFLTGVTDKYTWVDLGSSFGMADTLAAFLLGQLEARHSVLSKREAVSHRYRALLEPHEDELGFTCMRVAPDRAESFHMFYVLLDSRVRRDALLSGLADSGIMATFHYVPLHSAPAAAHFAAATPHCPVSEDIAGRLLRLPFHNNLAATDVDRIVARLCEVLGAV